MTWIQTSTRNKFHFLDVRSNVIHITDLAHTFSHICRFNGHCRRIYNLSEHSFLVARILYLLTKYQSNDKNQDLLLDDNQFFHYSYYRVITILYGLLHDGSETYLVDVPRPFKHLPVMHGYREMESQVQSAINYSLIESYYLSTTPSNHDLVKLADDIALILEANDLMNPLDDMLLPNISSISNYDLTLEDFEQYYNYDSNNKNINLLKEKDLFLFIESLESIDPSMYKKILELYNHTITADYFKQLFKNTYKSLLDLSLDLSVKTKRFFLTKDPSDYEYLSLEQRNNIIQEVEDNLKLILFTKE